MTRESLLFVILIVISVLLDCSTFPLCTMPTHEPNNMSTAVELSQFDGSSTFRPPVIVIADNDLLEATLTTSTMASFATTTIKTTSTTPKTTTVASTINTTAMTTTPSPMMIPSLPSYKIATKESMLQLPMYMRTTSSPRITTTRRAILNSDYSPSPSQLTTTVTSTAIVSATTQKTFEILQYPYEQRTYNYYGSNYRFPVYGRHHGIWTEKVKPTKPSTTSPKPPGLPFMGFDRPCNTYFDCGFRPAKNISRTWLRCENDYCACELLGFFKDEDSDWELRWSRKAEVCQADAGGPCGRNKGLEIHCKRGHRCIGSICLRPGRAVTTTTTTTPEPSSESCEDCSAQDDSVKENKPANVFSLILFPGLNFFRNVLNESLTAIGT